jgi:hypothetical protein
MNKAITSETAGGLSPISSEPPTEQQEALGGLPLISQEVSPTNERTNKPTRSERTGKTDGQ